LPDGHILDVQPACLIARPPEMEVSMDGGAVWRTARALALALALIFASANQSPASDPAGAEKPRYVCDPYCYNRGYLFLVTRAVHQRASAPVQLALSPLTLAVDIAFLPFAATLGLFG